MLQGSTLLAEHTYETTTNRLDYVTRANGTKTDYGYDRADGVRDIHTTHGTTTVSRFEYGVDRLGQRTSLTETVHTTVTPTMWVPMIHLIELIVRPRTKSIEPTMFKKRCCEVGLGQVRFELGRQAA